MKRLPLTIKIGMAILLVSLLLYLVVMAVVPLMVRSLLGVKSLSLHLIIYTSMALIISWLAGFVIARYLTRSLVLIEQQVKRIANHHGQEPLIIKPEDEIGRLARSIETLRQDLVQQDERQQSMLQNISHELKTPIMVIKSYTRAIRDQVYPRGDLAGSLQVIEEEAERLEKLVRQLLYLNRIDYLQDRGKARESISLDRLVRDIAERLLPERPEVKLYLDLPPLTIIGSEEDWRVIIENLLDNHLRYADTLIEISIAEDRPANEFRLRVWNDGPHIDQPIREQPFNSFQKGPGGKYGLGLSIISRIINRYHGSISLMNEGNGVTTMVRWPNQ